MMRNPLFSNSQMASLLVMVWIFLAAMLLSDYGLQDAKTEPTAIGGTIDYSLANDDEQLNKFKHGRKLFKMNCASCHKQDTKTAITGSALTEVLQCWKTYPKQDTYNFILDSHGKLTGNHTTALGILGEYTSHTMSLFPDITEDEMNAILTYVERGD